MSKIFITGIAGFLGSHLADAMIADGHTVVGIDNMIGGEIDNVPSAVEFHQVDCNDFSTVKGLMKGCDILYHCAATAYEGLSVFAPHIVTQNVVGASVSVISAAVANSVKRIVICSSMARYGHGMIDPNTFEHIGPPFKEWYTPNPQDPYGIGKVAVEEYLKNLCTTHGVEWVIAVPHNIIGPRQKYDDPYRNVASIMLNLNLQNRPVVIYGDGKQQRCFSYVEDCIQCLHRMAFDPDVVRQVINIGPDEEPTTINDLANLIAWETGFIGRPVYLPDRPQEVKVALCSSNKARRLLGYNTKWTLAWGVAEMADYIRRRGVKPFKYHLDLEIISEKTPRTWKERLF